jgi:hypothetical protein
MPLVPIKRVGGYGCTHSLAAHALLREKTGLTEEQT